MSDYFRSTLQTEEGLSIEAKSLTTDSLPAMIIQDEQTRRLQEYLQRINPDDTAHERSMPEHRTLVLNTNSPLLAAIMKLRSVKPEVANDLAKEVYELALLAQHQLKAERLNEFIRRSQRVLEVLANQSLK